VDRKSRFVVAWGFASSEEAAAPRVVQQTRERTRGRGAVMWVSDGNRVYETWVSRTYRDPLRTGKPGRPRLVRLAGVGLTQVIKTRVGRRIVSVRVRHCFGPRPAGAYTVHVERRNGVLRDRLNCLGRRTHAFAKHCWTWDALVTLSLFEGNWMQAHRALRVSHPTPCRSRPYLPRSPAMALGLSDHIWSWTEFLACCPARLHHCTTG
jgi:hypothetical protein